MKLGILGGSFNPIHLGHLFLADKALCALKLDRVIFVPAYQSPFKLTEEESSLMETNASDRLDMLAAAVTGESRFAIDACEVSRRGVSYTVDTLEDITERYLPEGKLTLIIGDDVAEDFPKWCDSRRILQLADIVIARRLGSAGSAKADYPYPHKLIDNDVINISSRMIRQRICEGGDWRSLVPSEVRAIIEDKGLYGCRSAVNCGAITKEVIRRVESAARATLSIERFLHSRSVAIYAGDLCRRFGIDPAAGYLAGIAHDIAKQLDNKQFLKIAKNAGLGISALEKGKPSLLHGKVGAVLLKKHFNIHNVDILEAVASHTSGSENMSPLAKVIYIADKTESTKDIDPAFRKMCMKADLDSILFAVLKKTVSKLQARKLDLSEDTIKLLKKMKE